MDADSEFGKEVGLVHKMIVTGRKVGAGRRFYSRLADDEELFRKVVPFVLSERKETIEFHIKNGSAIIGVFDDSIFDTWPGKAIEVMDKLIELIKKVFSVFPKGKFLLEVGNDIVSLSYNSGKPLSSFGDNYNAYGLALRFIEDTPPEDIKSLVEG